MSAREDYPLLAWMEGSAPWPEGPKSTLAESVTGALDHIEALRHVVEAALVWRRCKYATHGNTSEATRRHYQAVQWAERKLSDCLLDLLAEGAAGRGAPMSDDPCQQCADDADSLAWWRSQQ